MVEYICGLFPQAVGLPPVDPPPRALFESFFVPAPHSHPTLACNWFARVQEALIDADSRLAAWLAAGRSDRTFLPIRHSTYAVRGPHAASCAVPVNESLMSHFERPLRPSLQVGLTVRDLMTLEHFPLTIGIPLLCHVGIVRTLRIHPHSGFHPFRSGSLQPAGHSLIEEFGASGACCCLPYRVRLPQT